jgi:phosphoglycolate phosphatase
VADTLGQLRDRGYRIAVATGKSRRGLDRELDETGLRALVEASRCADETRSKPHPQMLHEVLAELAVPSKAAVMIGDTAHDLQMAQAAGVPSIAVGCGVQTLDELRAFLPVAAVPRVTALADVLLGAGRSISATVIDPS